jgi:hypothetical protein
MARRSPWNATTQEFSARNEPCFSFGPQNVPIILVTDSPSRPNEINSVVLLGVYVAESVVYVYMHRATVHPPSSRPDLPLPNRAAMPPGWILLNRCVDYGFDDEDEPSWMVAAAAEFIKSTWGPKAASSIAPHYHPKVAMLMGSLKPADAVALLPEPPEIATFMLRTSEEGFLCRYFKNLGGHR